MSDTYQQHDSGGASGLAVEEPLLGCLAILTRLFDMPRAPEALRAGLPDDGSGFNADMFARAAARVGLETQVRKRPVRSLRSVLLPAVVILRQSRACVLIRVSGQRATIMQPHLEGTQDVRLSALEKQYAGYVITAAPTHDQASDEASLGMEGSGVADGHWFWAAVSRNRGVYAQVALAALLVNLFALASPIFIMTVYDRVVPNNAMETLTVLAIGVATVFLFDFLVKTLRGYLIDIAGRRADLLVASRVFDQVLDLHLSARPVAAGAFANTLREFESLKDFFTSATLASLVDLPFILIFILFVSLLGGSIAWVLLAAVAITLLICLIIQFPLDRLVQRAYREGGTRHGVLVEAIGALETIKGIGADGRVRHKWERAVMQTSEVGTQSRLMSSLAINVTLLVQQLTTVAVVVVGVTQIQDGSLSMGALIACVILSSRALAPLAQVAQLLVRFHQARASYVALDRIMRLPVERPANRRFLHRGRLLGEIDFKEVRFTYPRGDRPALRNVSFRIGAGERVGIIGRVGSGKTTVQKLILGLYQPEGGSVLVDNADLRQLDPVDLRRNTGYLPQEVVLFRGTLRENIAYHAPQASDDEILRAARLSGLESFISQSPMGYDMLIGERGEGLSGGQRQAIALARALILDPPVLLLDEPTSAMDTTTEDQFKQRLAGVLENRTLVLVTHRASLLSLVDRLIVLDQGRVAADGPRQKVIDALSRPGGLGGAPSDDG